MSVEEILTKIAEADFRVTNAQQMENLRGKVYWNVKLCWYVPYFAMQHGNGDTLAEALSVALDASLTTRENLTRLNREAKSSVSTLKLSSLDIDNLLKELEL